MTCSACASPSTARRNVSRYGSRGISWNGSSSSHTLQYENTAAGACSRVIACDLMSAGMPTVMLGGNQDEEDDDDWQLHSAQLNARTATRIIDLTRPKISDREPAVASLAEKRWMANTHKVNSAVARGSLHRLVRSVHSRAPVFHR